jgi:REase_MTES_1575
MPHASAIDPVIGGRCQPHGTDAAIGELAAHQHGVVARAQLLDLGPGRRAIDHRVERGRLPVVHHGVYAVGHVVLSREGRWMAAVLAAGPGAVLSHRSAAALWGLRHTRRARIEVTVPRSLRPRPGIQVHRGHLLDDEVGAVHRIPVTTVSRTLLDLASLVDAVQLERALDRAEALRLADHAALADLIARHPRRSGTRALRALLATRSIGATVTRSELEDRFLAFLDDAVLPRPEVNVPLELGPGAWIEADCIWRNQRLIVELDGHAAHATPRAFERDRSRDRALQAAGWHVVRITWRQLHDEPSTVAADLRTLLQIKAPPGKYRK